MNWENPSPQTLEKYKMLIRLLTELNELSDPSQEKCRFSWQFSDNRMYIQGVPSSLGNLLSLLWCHTEHYAFYMFQEDGACMIEVLYI